MLSLVAQFCMATIKLCDTNIIPKPLRDFMREAGGPGISSHVQYVTV